ncbi:Crp/Fnr family transcriptional regulator (plasmid) [Rhodovastum atsumiense]|uniref:Crp/Fnr family transcriptional regulator n=1 Tax=Rhodovastum atsumiense TaxID=504468 RepID=A0A5M6IK99_9PROT|nr:Crp/Fnr family transcriptional regulator [Rhodovastum atsumiense]KAA5608299.1 Crp/Fnr family transcriptional regulator [Rhodovastum atsumiense]CAH2605832.1 Crp/Fnr family transcriptional regulator [Rhodovastum atsumiense]
MRLDKERLESAVRGDAQSPNEGQAKLPGAAAPDGNRLLASVSRHDLDRLAPDLEEVTLLRGQVLFEPGRIPSHVHFPHAGTMVSLVMPLLEGGAAETVTVGLEGAAGLGVDAADPTVEAFTRGLVQMPGKADRVLTPLLAKAASASPALRRLLARQAEAAMSMALQSVACRAAHQVRPRLARWLLTALDRAPGGDPALPLTQEFLAEMLGVRRATVGEAALALQAGSLIRIRRGCVVVLDRAGLERAACECHAALRRRFERLLQDAAVVRPADPSGVAQWACGAEER